VEDLLVVLEQVQILLLGPHEVRVFLQLAVMDMVQTMLTVYGLHVVIQGEVETHWQLQLMV
jgi:hypothetical protein